MCHLCVICEVLSAISMAIEQLSLLVCHNCLSICGALPLVFVCCLMMYTTILLLASKEKTH